MAFPRQEHGSRLPFPPSWDHPDPGIKPVSPELAGRFLTTEPPGKPLIRALTTFAHFLIACSIDRKLNSFLGALGNYS